MEYEDLRKKSLKAVNSVKWIPPKGRDRIFGMIENRPDWCISRQRSWGVPITVFFCESCNEWLYTKEIQEKIFTLFKEHGADIWFDKEAKDLLPVGQKCPHCGSDKFRKETDILDVWFDSGSSFAAVCEYREYLPDVPNMYLEGSDQHRGWFHSSLLISVANRNGRAPYKEVLTHGYVVDGKGKKMSKSLGNTVLPEEVIKKYGADLLRLWCASENYQEDIRVSKEIMDMLVKAYFNFRNTSRFLLGNLQDFSPAKNSVSLTDNKDPFDRYALILLNKLIKETKRAYDEYAFHDVYHKTNIFMGQMSSFYLDVLKDRLYTRYSNDPLRRGSQTVMFEILKTVSRIMAPILSFTAEEIWGYLPDYGKKESIFLEEFPKYHPEYQDDKFEKEMAELLGVRSVVLRRLEEARRDKIIGSSLDAEVHLEASGAAYKLLDKYRDNLKEFFIVSGCALLESTNDELKVQITASLLHKCPRCWTRDAHVPSDQSDVCPKCKEALTQINSHKK
jgi:isoleucyl-tRNA synthetase